MTKDTLAELGRFQFEDISTSIQRFEVMPRLIKANRKQLQSGTSIQRQIMTGTSGSAAMVQLYGVDATSTPTLMQNISIPWRHMNSWYQWERRELLMNRKPSQIVDIIMTRRHANAIAEVELLETQFWNKPTDSSDALNSYGVPTWIVKNNGAAGFNGTNPSGFTSGVGGLSSSTYTAWANYTSGYTNVTKDDLIAKGNTALRKINWDIPDDYPSYSATMQDCRAYVNESTYASTQRLLELQNQNLGTELSPYQDQVSWTKRVPMTWVPKLDADTTNPVYLIDFSCWEIYFLAGDEFTESPQQEVPNQHNVIRVFVDSTFNFVCHNRRRQAVLSV